MSSSVSQVESMANLKFTLVFLVALFCTAYSAKKYTTSASGKVSCRMVGGAIAPLKQVLVKLMDKDTLVDDTFAQTRSRTDGRFSLTGSARDLIGKPDPYIRIIFDYRGRYGHLEVDGLVGITRKYNTPKRAYAATINFGNIVISNDHCRAYVQFYEAMKNYYTRTGSQVPYKTLNVRTSAIVHGGTPYALRSRVNIPRGYTISVRTAEHELAHTVRHTLDGSFAHFLFDVARFFYLRHHTCSTKSNLGYAFNEGFAEFWANQCRLPSYSKNPTDYTVEGNVANALRALKQSCSLTDGEMVNILKKNPKKIHSFQQFKAKSGCK